MRTVVLEYAHEHLPEQFITQSCREIYQHHGSHMGYCLFQKIHESSSLPTPTGSSPVSKRRFSPALPPATTWVACGTNCPRKKPPPGCPNFNGWGITFGRTWLHFFWGGWWLKASLRLYSSRFYNNQTGTPFFLTVSCGRVICRFGMQCDIHIPIIISRTPTNSFLTDWPTKSYLTDWQSNM